MRRARLGRAPNTRQIKFVTPFVTPRLLPAQTIDHLPFSSSSLYLLAFSQKQLINRILTHFPFLNPKDPLIDPTITSQSFPVGLSLAAYLSKSQTVAEKRLPR